MKRVLILVEGQTEEAFVNQALNEHLAPRRVHATPTMLVTKTLPEGRRFKGGVTSYERMARDIRRLLNDTNADVTTLIDYYGLPDDFPGLASPQGRSSAQARVLALEAALAADINHQRFRPFLALHEFEAWVFAVPDYAANHFGLPSLAEQLATTATAAGGPEAVNNIRETCPSRRLMAALNQHHRPYGKVQDGPNILRKAGLEPIRAACPHFADWLAWMERPPS